MSTGISSARAATLFMKADSTPPTAPMSAIWAPSGRAALIRVRVIRNTAPERTSPAETTSTSATISVAEWPKPAKASFAGTTPSTTPTRRAVKATRS